MYNFKMIDDNITLSELNELLLSPFSVASDQLICILNKFKFEYSQSISHPDMGYKMKAHNNRTMTFDISLITDQEGNPYEVVKNKRYTNNKGELHNDNKPAIIYYNEFSGSVWSIDYFKKNKAYKSIIYHYDNQYDLVAEREIVSYWSHSIIAKNLCIHQLTIKNDKVIDGEFIININSGANADGFIVGDVFKNHKTFQFDDLVNVCHRFKNVSKNNFLELFNTITEDEALVFQMNSI